MEHTLQIHPSEVNAALMCELRLDDELAEDEPNRDMMRGSLTHHMIETDLLDEPMKPSEFVLERFSDEYGYAQPRRCRPQVEPDGSGHRPSVDRFQQLEGERQADARLEGCQY